MTSILKAEKSSTEKIGYVIEKNPFLRKIKSKNYQCQLLERGLLPPLISILPEIKCKFCVLFKSMSF